MASNEAYHGWWVDEECEKKKFVAHCIFSPEKEKQEISLVPVMIDDDLKRAST
jgi:hypothetical protein